MRVLLVWDETEETKFYMLENPSADDLEILASANGKMINVDEDVSDVDVIWNYLSKEDEFCEHPGKESNCKWSKFEVKCPIDGPIDKVFMTGFAS